MNIYLDIDGVILANDLQPANHVHEFLKYVINRYPTFWLTTHCKGDASVTVTHLSRWLDKESLQLTTRIRPTNWVTSKTEAIDWSKEFLWFDDQVFDFEKKDLIKHGVLGSWVEVDFSKDPDQLQKFVLNFPSLAK